MRSIHRSIFIAVTLGLIVLSGCQPLLTPVPSVATPCSGAACLPPTVTPTSKPVPTPTPTVFLGDQRSEAKDQDIIFWHSYSLNSSSLVKALVAEFNRENPDGIHVDIKAFYTDDQLQNALAEIKDQKDMPDVIEGETALLSSLDSDGSLPDLVNYISDPIIGLAGEQQKSIGANDWETVTRQNKVVGIPAQKEAFFLLYDQSWAKELGFDEAPQAFSEFTDQTKAALGFNITQKDRSYHGTGGWLINWQSSSVLAWMGPDFIIPEDGQTFNQPILVKTFSDLKKIQLVNDIWLGINPDPIPYFVNRQALFISASSRELAEMIIHLSALKMQDSWSIIPYSQFSASKSNFTHGSAFGLLSKSQEKQMAGWLFIQWMMQPERQAFIGVHEYTIPADQMAVDKMKDFTTDTVIIDQLVNLTADSHYLSTSPNWFITESILADGFRQLFQPETTVDLIPEIITEMDRTYTEYHK